MAIAGKKNFKGLIINRESSMIVEEFKCPKCKNTVAISRDMDFIFCTYIKCNWYDAYTKELFKKYTINSKFRRIK